VRYWSKIADFNLPHLYFVIRWGDPVGISARSLASENYSPWAIARRCLRNPAFSPFGTVPAYDRSTDRQTHDDSKYHARTASRGKKIEKSSLSPKRFHQSA